MIVPEKVLFDCYKKLIENYNGEDDGHELKVKTLDADGPLLANTLYPEWPCILVGNRRVQKNNIGLFMKKMCTINEKFRESRVPGAKLHLQEEKLKRLELLCQTHLHLITVSKLILSDRLKLCV